jgi:hypothetical protein
MHPVSLDVALIKLQLPGLILRPGMSVVARVASRGEGTAGAIVLAGQLLSASLPPEVRKGDTLRLNVAETSGERVIFKLESATPGPVGDGGLRAARGPAGRPRRGGPGRPRRHG